MQGHGRADEAIDELESQGAPPEVLEQFEAQRDSEEFEVLEENMPTVDLFVAVCTQWRAAPFGGWLGLDYPAVDVVLRRRALHVTPEQFSGLQVMEHAALDVLNDRGDG